MPKIQYVGLKPRKEDNVARTGVVWYGPGDVQEVPDAAVHALLKHPDVWALPAPVGGLSDVRVVPDMLSGGIALVSTPIGEVAPTGAEPAPGRFVLDGPTGPLVLDSMDDDELAALSKRLAAETDGAIKPVDGRTKGDKRRQAIIDAVKAATSTQEG